jgi:hypothetical protein
MPLERALSDFGYEHSFQKAVGRLNEHYGFELSAGSLARITLKHAKQIRKSQKQRLPHHRALPKKGKDCIIAQADGTLIRIVLTNPKAKDRRRSRKVDYKEARLTVAQARGSVQSFYQAGFETVDTIGQQWACAAKLAGRGLNTKVHALGDGAPWIQNQSKVAFGQDNGYLLDFYHLCDYLHEASAKCSEKPERWMKTQKKRLKAGRYRVVIKELKACLEPEHTKEEEAPVRKAYRYMRNRIESFAYDKAIAEDLPIGSGLIESGNKHVLQARLKIPGASWNIHNANAMAAARILRANDHWCDYWINKAA